MGVLFVGAATALSDKRFLFLAWKLPAIETCIVRNLDQRGTAMPILTVRHVTTYHYAQPVAFGEHRMMLRPRD